MSIDERGARRRARTPEKAGRDEAADNNTRPRTDYTLPHPPFVTWDEVSRCGGDIERAVKAKLARRPWEWPLVALRFWGLRLAMVTAALALAWFLIWALSRSPVGLAVMLACFAIQLFPHDTLERVDAYCVRVIKHWRETWRKTSSRRRRAD